MADIVREMTIEEKREALQKFCSASNGQLLRCVACPIQGPCSHYNYIFGCMPDVGVETCYNALQAHLVQPMVEDTNAVEKPLYDAVKKPQHYASTSVECIDMMEETQGAEAVINFCVCNAFKYLWRHNQKNGTEDIKKASWYLNKAVELMEKEKK